MRGCFETLFDCLPCPTYFTILCFVVHDLSPRILGTKQRLLPVNALPFCLWGMHR
jgi:hypothetical protein